jgi:hypothetical protein
MLAGAPAWHADEVRTKDSGNPTPELLTMTASVEREAAEHRPP